MNITLKQQHIEAAIKAYVAKAGIAFPVDNIDFTAGRGSSGLTATIEMEDPFLDSLPQASEAKAAPKVNNKPKAVETAPKAEPEKAVEVGEGPETEEPPFTPDPEEEAFAEVPDLPAETAELPEPKAKASLFG